MPVLVRRALALLVAVHIGIVFCLIPNGSIFQSSQGVARGRGQRYSQQTASPNLRMQAAVDLEASPRSRESTVSSSSSSSSSSSLLLDRLSTRPTPRLVNTGTNGVRRRKEGIDRPTAASTSAALLIRRRRITKDGALASSLTEDRIIDRTQIDQVRVKDIQRAAAVIQKRQVLRQELGRNPSMQEWAEVLGVNGMTLKLVLDRGEQARSKLVQGWSALVRKFVQKYRDILSQTELEDLTVEGYLGIVEAALRYDASKSNFGTYVYFWVRKQVNEAAQAYTKSTLVSDHDNAQASRIRQVQQEHMFVAGQPLSTSEMATKLNLSVSRIEELERRSRPCLSMEGTYVDGYVRYIDVVHDDSSDADVNDSMYLSQVEETVKDALAKLNEEERLVLGHRLGLADGVPKTWEEVAMLMPGCSASYLRKVEARAKTHLRRNAEIVKLIYGGRRNRITPVAEDAAALSSAFV